MAIGRGTILHLVGAVPAVDIYHAGHSRQCVGNERPRDFRLQCGRRLGWRAVRCVCGIRRIVFHRYSETGRTLWEQSRVRRLVALRRGRLFGHGAVERPVAIAIADARHRCRVGRHTGVALCHPRQVGAGRANGRVHGRFQLYHHLAANMLRTGGRTGGEILFPWRCGVNDYRCGRLHAAGGLVGGHGEREVES